MNVLDLALVIVTPLLSLTVVSAFIRLVRGPSLPDRVVALDLLSIVGIGVIAVYAIATNEPVFLDVAIILALVSFLGTVAFAYYLIRNADRADADENEE
jgi:multicomponent Na+:H+ antiporter subunit F